jgi:hypothetical protein
MHNKYAISLFSLCIKIDEFGPSESDGSDGFAPSRDNVIQHFPKVKFIVITRHGSIRA